MRLGQPTGWIQMRADPPIQDQADFWVPLAMNLNATKESPRGSLGLPLKRQEPARAGPTGFFQPRKHASRLGWGGVCIAL